MSLLEDLRNKRENRKNELIEAGKRDWPTKFLDSLYTAAGNLSNKLFINDNYYYLVGVQQAADKCGFGTFLTNCNDRFIATLTISWQ